ncbi:tryptophan 7-halogenase [Saccharothrix sp. Mg75]|uniref:tryptophan 7-halogenase n=1 Tax=Saccharothrix sp. Mg75 TaxID=3445357 RepID=UPI003EEBED8D
MTGGDREEDFDVVVVGGGPGGSTTAALVARQGHRVLLLERDHHPRYQIGESLLPATVHGVCRILGVADELANAGFPRKRGGTFKWGASPEPWDFSFALSPRMAGPTSYAYQVERARFDEILLRNAAAEGVEVREGCAVRRVLTEDDRVTGVEYTDQDGTEVAVRARYTIDASGNTSRLHREVGGARQYSPYFRNIAVFGYFAGGRRLPAPNSGNIFSVAFDEGWIWYIPLRDDLTSVGVVLAADRAGDVQADPERGWLAAIDRCPAVAEMLAGTPRATEAPYDLVRVRKDYSYDKEAFWRPGMALVGDAACFIDPVFSSGVHLATYSGLLAARSLNSVLADEVPEDVAFGEFEARYRREFGLFHEFLVAFYDLHQERDSYFWNAKRITGAQASEGEAFVELVGGIASGDSGVRAPAGGLAEAVAAAVDGGEGANPLLRAKVVSASLQEGAQLQALAELGEDSGPQTPLFQGGLVPSADGLRWVRPAG